MEGFLKEVRRQNFPIPLFAQSLLCPLSFHLLTENFQVQSLAYIQIYIFYVQASRLIDFFINASQYYFFMPIDSIYWIGNRLKEFDQVYNCYYISVQPLFYCFEFRKMMKKISYLKFNWTIFKSEYVLWFKLILHIPWN